MTMPWWCVLAGAGMALFGAVVATVLWWWAAPARLVDRWAVPLREMLASGFAEQALQQRLRSQSDALWTCQQQERWHESHERLLAVHEAGLLAEISVMLGVRQRPAKVAPAPAAVWEVPGAVAWECSTEALTDAQIDDLPAELPAVPDIGRRKAASGLPHPPHSRI